MYGHIIASQIFTSLRFEIGTVLPSHPPQVGLHHDAVLSVSVPSQFPNLHRKDNTRRGLTYADSTADHNRLCSTFI